MSPDELLTKCNHQIERAGPDTVMVLVLPYRKPKGDRVRLFGRVGPVGQVYSDIGGLTVGFKAAEVRDFIMRMRQDQEAST